MTYEEAVAAVTGAGERFEIGEEVVLGRSMPSFVNAPSSVKVLFESARRGGERTFLVYEDERWTFAEFMGQVDGLASALVNRFGIVKGDRVAIAMRNFPEWVVAYAATLSVGAIAVLVNAWWTADELRFGLEHCGAHVVVADVQRLALIEPLLVGLDVRAIVVRAEPDDVLIDGNERVERYEDVVEIGASMPEVDIRPEDDATILYTSGTTGRPKGAVSTHRAVVSACYSYACRAAVDAARRREGGPEPRATDRRDPMSFILVVPLFHVSGCIPVMLGALMGRLKLVMMYKWSPERALELIERERVTTFVGVPTMSWDLLESPDFATRDTSSLLNVSGGGAPAPPELVRRVDEGFARGRPGIGYGMTETNSYGPQNSGDDYVSNPTSAGRVLPILGVRVVDELGEPVPVSDIGEIEFRGPNLVRGYWNDEPATEALFHDSWMRTGDLGRVDEDGFVYVEDRKKDIVLRGGENIYCAEVEAALYEHPAVYEAAVFGVPHERLGEELAAAIVLRADADTSAEAIQAHVGERLAAFKVPSRIVLTDHPLPRGATGKVLKRELRDELISEH